MKLPRLVLLLAALLPLASLNRSARAATFTSDTTIGAYNTTYEGQDIIVINCTLTVDGSHTFSDILIVDNGTLTHSFSTDGVLQQSSQVTNELQTLTGTNYSTLNYPFVVQSSVVVTGATNGVTYAAGTDYILSPGPNSTTQIARTAGSTIPDGSAVEVSYIWVVRVPTGLNLVVSNNVVIEAGSAIDADGRGYGGLNGPGAGAYITNSIPFYSFSGGGGAYGGNGGASLDQAPGGASYGAMVNTAAIGSGGGIGTGGGGAGGGAITLSVGGALELDGVISASGSNGVTMGSGGGSGGGIFLALGDFAGAGSIVANGGAGEVGYGGGGGGGRVFISCGFNEFTGGISAHGGVGFVPGGAGTIYTRLGVNPDDQLTIDNGGLSGAETPFSINVPNTDLLITNGAVALAAGPSQVFHNLFVSSSGVLTFALPVALQLTVANATIQPGGAILVDGLGGISVDGFNQNPGQGPGGTILTNSFSSGGGGGHSGHGAASTFGAFGGVAYDLPLTPTQLGSIGGSGNGTGPYNLGGFGGGAVRLTASGVVMLGGLISANGTSGGGEGSGGGSGGSIWISAANISGAGTVSAHGGAGQAPYGGGGGGGCIAIYSSSNTFAGNFLAGGGGGANRGGAGTVYTQLTGGSIAQLVLDNGGAIGTNTPLPSASGYDLTISGGAVATPASSALSLHNLLIASNSAFTLLASTSIPMQLTLTGNGAVQQGGNLTLDGRGYAPAQGPGAGLSTFTNGFEIGGGAGHGGFGGSVGNPVGGAVYDTITQPTQAGSGGGRGIGAAGGSGGGGLQLHVNGSLIVAGGISVNGGAAVGEDCGGGSGGAILLTAGTVSGNGSIAANGSAGALPFGGGGAGGRIAIITPSNNFTGVLAAHGGPGAVAGGAGTIYVQNTASQSGLIVIDNGGLGGTNTPLQVVSGIYDLMVTNGATAAVASSQFTIRNLVIAANSFLTSSGNLNLLLTVNSATVQAGGGINLDGKGYAGGIGLGAGLTLITNGVQTGGGGGHGGSGGISATGAGGGTNYDNPLEPIQFGSGGGAGMGAAPYNLGGAGGGILSMRVNGTLLVDGSITANGVPGVGQGSGGGAGGSIQLSAGKWAGAGIIAANGGAGKSSMEGGGGAGGCIALIQTAFQIQPPTNPSFAGTVSAHGGPGFVAGGAGTIYRRSSSLPQPSELAAQIMLDNGGTRGASTPFPQQSSGVDLSITGGANVMGSPQLQSIRSLLIGSNSLLTLSPALVTTPPAIQLTVTAGATIQAGGGIVVDGDGYLENHGQGEGRSATSNYGPVGGGGGYGGTGGAGGAPGTAGGVSYDSITQPSSSGSGGGSLLVVNPVTAGGSGGGRVQLTVTGTLQVDGAISANGNSPLSEGSGGGAGGGILLTVGVFSGAGSISANGGAGSLPYGGGGGGGRIAIYFNTNHFTGTISAVGGVGFGAGGAGTIYTQIQNPLRTPGQLLVDNGGLIGAFTPISAPAILPVSGSPFGLTVSGGGQVQPEASQPLLLNSLRLGSGAALTQPGTFGTLNVTVLGDILIDTNAVVSADGQGYIGAINSPADGPGAGSMLSTGSGSGAGYGGAGGASSTGVPGGPTYGSSLIPTNWGSRGGLNIEGTDLCRGGGAVLLRAGGALTVNGTVTANGDAGLYEGTGGGSGGGVFLTAQTLAGSGSITANGGSGELSGGGGGGGGGRIAAYYQTNDFTGLILVVGGPGAFAGQTGTVYLSTNISPLQIVSGVVTNISGQPMANVSLQPSGLPAVLTDANGNYSVPVSLGWSGTITPSYHDGVFIPGSLSYTSMTPQLTGQNYLFVPRSSLTMTCVPQGTGLTLSWFGAGGVQYQVQCSTNLTDWLSCGSVTGANGPIQFQVPYSAPQMFFRIGVGQ